jgi:hypothetical protein
MFIIFMYYSQFKSREINDLPSQFKAELSEVIADDHCKPLFYIDLRDSKTAASLGPDPTAGGFIARLRYRVAHWFHQTSSENPRYMRHGASSRQFGPWIS